MKGDGCGDDICMNLYSMNSLTLIIYTIARVHLNISKQYVITYHFLPSS